ncbi:CYFIP-related Rac1 interactor B [Hyalella azteca]|uniref:CYFIP-related Rac1 interactor B n=1 Tax=Hyalella azteca TaxID=294128 RepID=A0A8B7PMY8_HYAAZ|nr:CYFIP-related Rac1 interactor B [Hyalella azteca]XP_018026786.1 CYFIP-related Rac1 interactor B [Hyalella azteca]
MGNLLRLLSREDNSCCSHNKFDFFLDFENAVPSESEEPLFLAVSQVLETSGDILKNLQQYKGAAKEIREAISDSGGECQRRAWEVVIPLVQKLFDFYQFSHQLEEILPRVLLELCSPSIPPVQHLETQQALVKQLADILEFTLKFDELKMTTPAIQNDFSYYRRTMMRTRLDHTTPQDLGCNGDSEEDISKLDHQTANKMSLFYAYPTPMLRVISEATSKFVAEHKEIPLEQTTETLGTMAKVCQKMLENPDLIARFKHEETQLFILRVMVALVILYDHVHPVGAFAKTSHVDVKGCIKVLKEQPASSSENLLNALRYTTKHLNDDSTPKHIRTLLAV